MAITATIDYRPSNRNSTGINDGSFSYAKGALDVRRLCSRIPHLFPPKKHAPVIFRQTTSFFSYVTVL